MRSMRATAWGIVIVLWSAFPASVVSQTPSYDQIAARIAGIDPADPKSLGPILTAASEIEAASLTDAQENDLGGQLTAKFNDWIRGRVDEIDPTVPGSLKDIFDIQTVQRTSAYEDYTDEATKAYKHEQLGAKFNEWVRNRVDEIDPSVPDSLKDFFDLQLIQNTPKYGEFATQETDQYKHEQMGQKFNEWVRNRVDEIDPSDPNSLRAFFELQVIQNTEKYEEFATPETHEYKEAQMREKFNEWVRNRVDDLDPNDPGFLGEIEKLRVVQLSEKYDKFATAETRDYKESRIRDKFGRFVRDLTDQLDPLVPTFARDLADLRILQESDLYDIFCPAADRAYKEEQVSLKLSGPPGAPPLVAAAWPESGMADVSIRRPMMIAFDQPMIPESIPGAVVITPPLPFTVTGMDNGHVWLVHPDPSWAPSTGYSVLVTPDAMSQSGFPLAGPVEILFQTQPPGTPPEVISTFPQEGDPEASGGAAIEIRFDQPMWPPSLEGNLALSPPTPHAASWCDGDTLLVIQPLQPLLSDQAYQVEIAAGVESASGVPLPEPFRLGFFTGIHGLAWALGSLPPDGQTEIPANHPIEVVFNRPMDTASVENALRIDPPIEFVPLWFETGYVLQIEPVYSLEPGTTYSITIDDSAVTTFGSPLAGGYAFGFTTADAIYPQPLRLDIVQTETGIEILADPGDMHEYLVSFAPGETLPVPLFRSEEVETLQDMIDAYLAGSPSEPPIWSTEYDPSARAARYPDPLPEGATVGFFKAILEY